ncbi:hypothetical protein STH12_00242 [Shewanella khirikhana]|uniref:Uncharacterized protein n=1 Tax=Shewanella khirikhana TaxID=1965282 RepID=A0ABM7CZ66_9GAMM|nr:hypothetical protein STH12_00242 [Shewanella khirikhana]
MPALKSNHEHSIPQTLVIRALAGILLLLAQSTSMADEGKALLGAMMDTLPKANELELARKRMAETHIERPWDIFETSCPYKELSGTEEEEEEFFYRCQRWNDCAAAGGSASIYAEAFFQNHQRAPKDQVPWESYRDGSMFLLEAADFERVTGHLRQHALKSAEENWRLFEGRDATEASDLVEKSFWQWCSAEPLALWKAEYQ